MARKRKLGVPIAIVSIVLAWLLVVAYHELPSVRAADAAREKQQAEQDAQAARKSAKLAEAKANAQKDAEARAQVTAQQEREAEGNRRTQILEQCMRAAGPTVTQESMDRCTSMAYGDVLRAVQQ